MKTMTTILISAILITLLMSKLAFASDVALNNKVACTFWHPAFGNCSFIITGKTDFNSLSVVSIRQDDCAE